MRLLHNPPKSITSIPKSLNSVKKIASYWAPETSCDCIWMPLPLEGRCPACGAEGFLKWVCSLKGGIIFSSWLSSQFIYKSSTQKHIKKYERDNYRQHGWLHVTFILVCPRLGRDTSVHLPARGWLVRLYATRYPCWRRRPTLARGLAYATGYGLVYRNIFHGQRRGECYPVSLWSYILCLSWHSMGPVRYRSDHHPDSRNLIWALPVVGSTHQSHHRQYWSESPYWHPVLSPLPIEWGRNEEIERFRNSCPLFLYTIFICRQTWLAIRSPLAKGLNEMFCLCSPLAKR